MFKKKKIREKKNFLETHLKKSELIVKTIVILLSKVLNLVFFFSFPCRRY